MIVTEHYTRDDGVGLIRTYSDQQMMIRQDETGILYSDAIDIESLHQTYTETNIPIEEPEADGIQN